LKVLSLSKNSSYSHRERSEAISLVYKSMG
jgi:hypothetical protein